MKSIKKAFKGLVVLSLFTFLCSCATNKVSDLYEFYEIDSVGESKLFGYRFVLDPSQRQVGKNRRSVPAGFAVSFVDMREELEKYMKLYPYCQEGYFVYDESFDGQEYKLLAECQESK